MEATLQAPHLDKRIIALIQTHKLTTTPVRAPRSPTGDSYLLITSSLRVADATLFEGSKTTATKRWRVKTNWGGNAGSLHVAWHPSGRVVAVYGAIQRRTPPGSGKYTPVLRLWRPRAPAKGKVADARVAAKLFKFAEGEHQACRRLVRPGAEGMRPTCSNAFDAYKAVVTLDNSRITAWYMAARAAALEHDYMNLGGDSDDESGFLDNAIDALRMLKKRGDKRALALLRQARKERDLKSLWKRAKFLALFQ